MEDTNKKGKREKRKKNAYVTLEASLIFPMIFGGILFTISLAIYLYHAAVVKQITSIAALRGSLEYQISNNEVEKLVEGEIEKLIEEKLFSVSEVQKEIKVTESKVQVRLNIKVKLPFLKIPFLDFKWQQLDFESQARRVKPVKIIRDTRRLYGS